MKNVNRKIVFVNWLPSLEKVEMESSIGPVFSIDPTRIEKTASWDSLAENVRVHNEIYGELFEEFVQKGYNLVCFWPDSDCSPTQRYELEKAMSNAHIDFEWYRKNGTPKEHRFSFSELESYKEFLISMLESVCEDLQLNDGLESLMTLKSPEESIEILKLNEDGEEFFLYFRQRKDSDKESTGVFFESFPSLIQKLKSEINMFHYSYTFQNRLFEKVFYSHLITGGGDFNLVADWEKSVSLN
ncbi:hypothetical protein [Algoriphagus namhaensis]